jgi:hypothetical protein
MLVETRFRRPEESGFALILALLALMVLTFLGLTLATTTSTELQIATNYRWGQQAHYNAEAGIEIGKRFLRQLEWTVVLPPARTAPLANCADGGPTDCNALYARPGAGGEPSRNWENADCDTSYLEGYGVVLDHPTLAYPFQNVASFLGQTLNGSFTLWIRRGTQLLVSGDVQEDPSNSKLILTSEGTAPFVSAASQFTRTNRAVRFLEVTLSRTAPGDCENRRGQFGAGPTGSGFDQCDAVRAEGILGGVTEVEPTK